MTMLTGSRIFSAGCFAFVLTVFAGNVHAADVEVGDTYDSVIEELGHPLSAFEYQGEQWLEYDRGKVRLEGGKVVSADIVSEAEGRTRQKEREEEAAAMAEKRAAKAKAARAKRAAAAEAKAEADKKAGAKKKEAKVTEEEPVGTPPGLNRRKKRRYSRSKSRQQAYSNQVVEARMKEREKEGK